MKKFNRGIVVVVVLVLVPASLIGAEGPEADLAASYEFSFPGGMARLRVHYHYSPPHTLGITRVYLFGNASEARSCTYEVPACGQTEEVDSCDLEKVLLDPHVLALWPDEGEKVYGGDARHYDGAVFTIAAPEKGQLTVGVLCRDDSAECSSEHQALLDLRRAFTDLASQARLSPGCATLKR